MVAAEPNDKPDAEKAEKKASLDIPGILKGIAGGIDPNLRTVILYGGAIIVGIILIFVILGFMPKEEAKVVPPVPAAATEESLAASPGLDPDMFVLPDLPSRIDKGEFSPAFPPQPRWNLEDFARYLPDARELLLRNLAERNDKSWKELLESIED